MPPVQFEDRAYLKLAACRDGVMLFNPLDSFVGRSVDLYGEFSRGEAAVFDQIVAPGDTVLDVGANIGAHTLWMARRVGPAGSVIAFEPQRAVFQTLCANMALNGMTNVDPYWAAVGAQPGYVTVPRLDPTAAANFGATSLIWGHPGDKVRMMSIDELELSACRMIKVDVEGMELDALRGAEATISRLRPILYVENDGREAGLIEFILDLGYRAWWHLPAYFSPETRAAAPTTSLNRVFRSTCSACTTPFRLPFQAPSRSPDRTTNGPDRRASRTERVCPVGRARRRSSHSLSGRCMRGLVTRTCASP